MEAGAPSSTRIVHDVTRCFEKHSAAILMANGTVVPGLGSRKGHRKGSHTYASKAGGKRQHIAYAGLRSAFVHTDAIAARNAMIKHAKRLCDVDLALLHWLVAQ